jgi:hypothetical protein
LFGRAAVFGDVLRAVTTSVRWGLALLACAVLAAPIARAQATPAESRVALVIGNGAYKQAPLRNAVADARLMDAALREAGFEVLRAENATLREMRRLVRDFGERLQRSQGVGLFYFAGHGVQLNGENYLVSIDSDIRHEDEVPDDSISAQLVLEKMESARNRVNILVLDACRNNPFASKTRGSAGGLALMNAPAGTLVAYATAPGAVAYDGSGANGLYTRHLAQQMREPGLRVEEVFKRVRAAVRRESSNQQTPWENTALEGEFFFRPGGPAAAAVPPPPQAPAPAETPAFELAFWDSIKNSTRRAELEEYLKQFPQGRFAGLVRSRLAALEGPGAPVPVPAPPAAPPRPPDAQVAVARPAAPAAVPRPIDAPFAAGDRLLFKDFDPISGADMREFSRTVTASSEDLFELDGGLLRIGPGARGVARGGSHAEIVPTGSRVEGSWPAQFVPAGGQAEAVPLRLRFERDEVRRVGGRELRLARAAVSGFASRRDGIPGIPSTYGAMMRGHVLLEPERGIVLEVHVRSDNPYYALRRELAAIETAGR